MASDVKATVYEACRLLLRPIASLAMKCGMTWKEFAELAKPVFIAVATEEFGIRGRPTNISRVSILTGISRKEVKRQRELLASAEAPAPGKTNDATRVLSGWHVDEMYRDRSGAPLRLPERGPAPSFQSLFQRYGGDTPFQTLLKELKSAGSVTSDDEGRLIALRRFHMPAPMSEENVRLFGASLHDHATTLQRNITGTERQRRFEGSATNDRVDPDATEAFRRFVDARGQQFLEEIDDWLERHRIGDDEPARRPIRLGVGLYAIQGRLAEGN